MVSREGAKTRRKTIQSCIHLEGFWYPHTKKGCWFLAASREDAKKGLFAPLLSTQRKTYPAAPIDLDHYCIVLSHIELLSQ